MQSRLTDLPEGLRNMITKVVTEQRDLKDKQLRHKVNRLNLLHALRSTGFRPKDEIVAPELEASITVCKQAEHKRLERQKLVDLGIDQEIIAAASIKVPSKEYFIIRR